MMNVGVIGLGFVGLPLCVQFARFGADVLGPDIDYEKIRPLGAGESYTDHLPGCVSGEFFAAGKFGDSEELARVADLDAMMIRVPTPLNKNREPDSRVALVLDSSNATEGIAAAEGRIWKA